jgi:hypothetical protein
LGIGDWGLGIGDWGLGPIPNPQSPITNPQSPIPIFEEKINNFIDLLLLKFKYNILNYYIKNCIRTKRKLCIS